MPPDRPNDLPPARSTPAPHSLLDGLAPLLHRARSAEERRALLAAALDEHRRQARPLFAAPPERHPGDGAGLGGELLRAAAEGASAATRQHLQPLAQRHPWGLLALAAAAGAALALTRPQRLLPWGWRWVRPVLGLELSNAVHGVLRQGLRGAWRQAVRRGLVGAVRQGLAPQADRPGPEVGLS